MADEQTHQAVKTELEEPTGALNDMDATEDRSNEADCRPETSMESTNANTENESGIRVMKNQANDDTQEVSQDDTQEVSQDDTHDSSQDDLASTRDGEEEEDAESDQTEDKDVKPIQPLATTRSRRANAGNRMGAYLLEEEDEFYSTHYGGFMEEEDDDDFDEEEEADKVEVAEDYDVDSDFDIDETDEIAPEHQAVEEERRTKKSAYREPKRKIHQAATSAGVNKTSTPILPKVPPTPQSPSKHRPERSFRDSTKKKTAETIKNIESVKKRKKNRNIEPHRRLTQEEMLEEAKITEADNLRSLEIYRRLEAENLKKIKLIKKSIPTPYITYYSSVFTNPETEERYSRNLCTYVGCEPEIKNSVANVT